MAGPQRGTDRAGTLRSGVGDWCRGERALLSALLHSARAAPGAAGGVLLPVSVARTGRPSLRATATIDPGDVARADGRGVRGHRLVRAPRRPRTIGSRALSSGALVSG